ncbi:rhomboid protease PCP1 [Aspergillus undulatus]|uniref:rhomboid protease PCP1 n=1 Tax=Aspergillus undulatus TaxID=1810928 RepID=UPI003CCCDBEA
MSNVLCVAWRTPCLGLRPANLHLPNPVAPFRSPGGQISPTWYLDNAARRLLSSAKPFSAVFSSVTSARPQSLPYSSRNPSRCFQTSSAARASGKPTPTPTPVEKGVQLRDKPFSKAEIDQIFGARTKLSPAVGNRILAILQARRLAGTLDLDLPADIKRAVRPATFDSGLDYLRRKYPMDEDAAIMARIEREDRAEEERLARQAEELGLYKPQSGSYGAELGEKNDPSGRSVLKQIRERNEKILLAEADKKRKAWLEGEEEHREKIKQQLAKSTALQKLDDTSAALEIQGRADPSQRPLLAWIQKHHLQATDTVTDFSKITTSSRLTPAIIFTLLTLGLCYGFAVTYHPPARADRMWPDIPPAAVTVAALIGMNAGVFVLWHFPPAWKYLNRYFLSVAVNPHVFSLIGNVFSHQKFWHLATNMFVLWCFGTRLHDDIGRGNFLALYLASGVLGSFASLTWHVTRNALSVNSLGASGAIAGVLAACALINPDEKWTVSFLPYEWQQALATPAWKLLTGYIALEAFGILMRKRSRVVPNLDYHAHFGGYAMGATFALWYRERVRREKERNWGWLDRVISK